MQCCMPRCPTRSLTPFAGQDADRAVHRLQDGKLPGSWGGMASLRRLGLSGCGLQGSLPGSWGALGALDFLNLGDNPGLEGPLPPSWGQLQRLQHLDISLLGSVGAQPCHGACRAWEACVKLRRGAGCRVSCLGALRVASSGGCEVLLGSCRVGCQVEEQADYDGLLSMRA